MRRRAKHSGLSMVQTIATLSIIGTVAMLLVPNIAKAKRETRIVQCAEQLNEIALAIKKYQHDNAGKLPARLGALFPRYVEDSDTFICPFVRQAALNSLQGVLSDAKRRGVTWSTYFLYSQKGLDELARRGSIEMGYTEILRQRGPDTPLVMCRDHREPFSLNPLLGMDKVPAGISVNPRTLPIWDYPEEPIIVVRYDGRVQKSSQGGTLTHHTAVGTVNELETL